MGFDRAAWVRLTASPPPHEPRPWDEVADALRAAAAAGASEVWLGGGEPTASPDLLRAVREARALGLRPGLVTGGAALGTARRLDALRDAGVHRVAIHLDEPRAAGAAARALAALAVHPLPSSLFVVLDAPRAARIDAWIELAVAHAAGLCLARRLGPPPDGPRAPPTPGIAAAIDRAWHLAAAYGVPLDVDDLAHTPPTGTSARPPPPLDANLAALFERGALPTSASEGVLALGHDGTVAGLEAALGRSGPLRQLGPGLAAAGAPPVDLPACLGGADVGAQDRAHQDGCTPCPRRAVCPGMPAGLDGMARGRPPSAWRGAGTDARVVVLWPWLDDKLLTASTVPALAAALAATGAPTRLVGRWDLTFDPTDLRATPTPSRWQRAWSFLVRSITRRPDPYATYRAPDGAWGHPLRWDEPPERAAAIESAFWEQLDLSDADVVIAPGWHAGAQAAEHPTLPRGARVVLADFHLLVGAEPWMRRRLPAGDAPRHGTWWPGNHVEVHACFPRFQGLYRGLGVPLRHVHWRPYPVHLGHVGGAPPPDACDGIFSGGRHLRDFATLEAAAARLAGRVHPIRIHASPGAVPPTPPLAPLGMAELPGFVDAIRTSRFVVLPLQHDVARAAGISVVALALASGRPVVATRTPAMVDHVRDGVDGLLVPPADPEALADAIARVDGDAVLRRRLHEGAQEAALRLSVTRWAHEIVHGAPARAFTYTPGATAGTAYAW